VCVCCVCVFVNWEALKSSSDWVAVDGDRCVSVCVCVCVCIGYHVVGVVDVLGIKEEELEKHSSRLLTGWRSTVIGLCVSVCVCVCVCLSVCLYQVSCWCVCVVPNQVTDCKGNELLSIRRGAVGVRWGSNVGSFELYV
jgi:hypothetical protein